MTWQIISEQITLATGQAFRVESYHRVSGGDINAAFRLLGGGRSYFVKRNKAHLVSMFAAEYRGLQDIARTQTVRVPKPIVFGQTPEDSFLVLENVELGRGNPASDVLLGEQLALMHQLPQPYFGWHRDNTIGTTLQNNPRSHSWCDFWRDQRLYKQLTLAQQQGHGGRLQHLGDRLCADLAALFADYAPTASLVHGDLWAGNAAVDQHGQPVIFDPACYYGDREVDVAMTELFGGFSQNFYAAYQSVWPLQPGYELRKSLYNLYHILNHLNLFGGSYLRQAESIMDRLLADLR